MMKTIYGIDLASALGQYEMGNPVFSTYQVGSPQQQYQPITPPQTPIQADTTNTNLTYNNNKAYTGTNTNQQKPKSGRLKYLQQQTNQLLHK